MTTIRLVETAQPTALEFFSGIGAFSLAARQRGIKVLQSYDQSEAANEIFTANFNHRPNARNLDSIKAEDLPAADIWWLSPPCTPYSVRGKRADANDPRALSLHNLINLIPHLVPKAILVENVIGFIDSQMRTNLIRVLEETNYDVVSANICSTDLGVPMKRPRHFIVAVRGERKSNLTHLQANLDWALRKYNQSSSAQPLTDFLHQDTKDCDELFLDDVIADKYRAGLNVIDIDDRCAIAICFTSGYWTSNKASGSYIKDSSGRIRRFSSKEMLQLFGFGKDFVFPVNMPEKTRSRLIGNSVDVRVITLLLAVLGL
jgi:site-specific DNA-cytosine methylase